ncbi:MAG: thiamine pyrophosphate-binding protein [Anaerolineae bacterium]|nr:thiamine pyrophosphate-binding protein [Anaerolineae bacterium]
MNMAEAIAQALREAGIRRVYGLPGGENVEVLEALRRSGMDFVLVHNESSALYMAAAAARLEGRPGVCLTTLGPGLANAMAGLGHAWLDRAPLLLLTAQVPAAPGGRHTHQLLDQQALTRPLTKVTRALQPGDDARAIVHDLLRLAVSGRPGPVHLQLSRDLAASPATPVTSATAFRTPAPVSPDLADLERAQALWRAARRRLLLVGLGLDLQGCHAELLALAEASQAPVIVTPKAKGAIRNDHPLAAGTIGLTRADPVYELLDETDCLLAVGFDVVELVRPWEADAPLIWLAPWENADPQLPAAAEFPGEMAPVLRQLTSVAGMTDAAWGATRVRQFRESLAQRHFPAPESGRMAPRDFLAALRRATPADTPLAVDVGSHKILASLEWPDLQAQRFLLSNGLSCMGYGLAAAIGASLALERGPALCLSGDAGIAMVLGELELVTRLDLPVVTVVLNDGALDLIRLAQLRAGAAAWGTEFGNPDFAQIARAFGIPALRSGNLAACETAVRDALHTRQPLLVDALIDPSGYCLPG